MFPYFSLSADEYKMSMGMQALGEQHLIEVDPDLYGEELALKARLLVADYTDYFRATPGSEEMQWETLELLLPRLTREYPHYFSLARSGRDWSWHNALLKTETTFRLGDDSSLALPPLDWLGRQVQEDLLILGGAGEMLLLAGQLCFPNSWSLEDKLGKPFLAIHNEVPLFADRLGRPSTLLLQRLKPGRPVWRTNWSLKTSPQLNQILHAARAPQPPPTNINLTNGSHEKKEQGKPLAQPPHIDTNLTNGSLQDLSAANIGERCYLRVERQTLSRLPRSNAILFTIHTYQSPLAPLVRDPTWARRLAGTLRTTPAEILTYKGITPFLHPLLTYLQTHTT